MNRTLTDEEKSVLLQMSGDIGWSFARLSERSGVPVKRVRDIVRSFRVRGWADYGPLFSGDDGLLHGRGYCLNKLGMDIQDGHTCDSCGGLNISCPEGCERDPNTGELIHGDETKALVERARQTAKGFAKFPQEQSTADLLETLADRLESLSRTGEAEASNG